jgi:hypothetical protein
VNSAFIVQINSELQQATFVSDTTVRVQYTLFASLSVTLLAAFFAVLGKQWILYYRWVTTWGDGGVVDRGEKRQTKFMGLQTWKLHLIIESLPGMLQWALYFFGAGMAYYLWDLDVSTEKVAITATLFGMISFTCTTLAATLWRDCPFQTPLLLLPPGALLWVVEFAISLSRWWKRWITSVLPPTEQLTEHDHPTSSIGRAFKIFASGMTTPNPAGEGTATSDYPVTLSNPAFWRDHPLFTSPIPKDIAASAGFWLLENSTDFLAVAAFAAIFPEVQWPSHHHSTAALIRLRDMYVECFQEPEPEDSARLKALRSAAAYYVLYHTQLIWITWGRLGVGTKELPPDLFLHKYNDEWDGDGVFEYLLHIDVEDRSESVKSARFLSYIAPYWFCGDSDSTIESRPDRLQTLEKLIEVLEKSQALTRATVTDCILCAGAAMDFPLHPEDLIRVDKRCVPFHSYFDGGTDLR